MTRFDIYDILMRMLEIIERDVSQGPIAISEEEMRKIIAVVGRIDGDILLNQISLKEGMEMKDQYNIDRSQIGAVGPDVHIHDINFDQAWNQSCKRIDLSDLANELSILRVELRRKAVERGHDVAVVAVADAEVAANERDGPRALEHLAKTGRWALDIATKIGVTIASEAIKVATGLE